MSGRAIFLHIFIRKVPLSGVKAAITVVLIGKIHQTPTKYAKASLDPDSFIEKLKRFFLVRYDATIINFINVIIRLATGQEGQELGFIELILVHVQHSKQSVWEVYSDETVVICVSCV